MSFWERALKGATEQAIWRGELSRLSWSAMFQVGTALKTYLEKERADFVTVLGELGLLKAH